MDFYAVFDQVVVLLQQRGRASYRALQMQFHLDDDQFAALKEELVEVQQLAVEQDSRMLVWTGGLAAASPPATVPISAQNPVPRTYTPPYLVEQILSNRHVLEGERKQVTVLFADIKGSTELIASHYRQALALAEELGMRPLQAHCHRGLGTLYARQGQWQQAHAALAAAIELYRAMAMTFWLPEAEAALTQVEAR
jgi:tetratricopeptide (TPR) repeat protein